jgi:hypothetical protein
MKKLFILSFFVSSCMFLSILCKAQTNDMDNLQKQVTALKSCNSRLESRFNKFTKISACLHDSLQADLNNNNTTLQTLSDSLKAKELQLTALKAESENTKATIQSIKTANTVQYICLILIIIIALVIYYFLSKKLDESKKQQETDLIKAKEGLESNMNKSNNEIKSEIASVKDDLQVKIIDLAKKLAAINKQDKG